MSLKQKLNDLIKSRNGGMVSINEIYQVCDSNQYKYSNAERRLRSSESPNIERVFKNGAIIGYRYKQSETVKQFLSEWGPKPKVEPVKTGQLSF